VHTNARASRNDSRAEACAIAGHAHALLPCERATSAPSSVANTRLSTVAATDPRATVATRRESVVEHDVLRGVPQCMCSASLKSSRTKVSASCPPDFSVVTIPCPRRGSAECPCRVTALSGARPGSVSPTEHAVDVSDLVSGHLSGRCPLSGFRTPKARGQQSHAA
jgi:hypothetical protein